VKFFSDRGRGDGRSRGAERRERGNHRRPLYSYKRLKVPKGFIFSELFTKNSQFRVPRASFCPAFSFYTPVVTELCQKTAFRRFFRSAGKEKSGLAALFFLETSGLRSCVPAPVG
jgi:hypothetical protein